MIYLKNLYSIIKIISLKEFSFLIFLMTIATTLEFIGISLIVPFVAILTGQNTDFLGILPENFMEIYKSLSKNDVFIYGLFIFFVIYLIKSIYLSFFNFKLNQFVFKSEAKLCGMLFEKHLNSSYFNQRQEDSSVLIRNLTIDIHLFAEAILLQGLIVLAEIIVTIFLVSFLAYIYPLNTLLIILIISLITLLFIFTMKKRLNFWGEQRQKFGALIIQQINEGFASIKEIALYKKQSFFTKILKEHSYKKAESSIYQNFFVSLPRLTFEFIAILSILVVSVLMISLEYNLNQILQFIVVFGIICFRLLPASNRILNYLQVSIYHRSVIKVLYDHLYNSVEIEQNKIKDKFDDSKELIFKDKISLENVSFKYPKGNLNILKNTNIEIKKNDFFGVMGLSGSGKSTLITLLMGIFKPDSGIIKCDGINIHKNIDEWQNKIGYVPQDVFLKNDTIKKNIAFGEEEKNIDDKKIEKVVDMVFLRNFVDNLPDKINTIVGERGANISGGQKQRIGIARALYRSPEILIMDESTNSLDKVTENDLIEDLFKFKNKFTLILISHNKSVFKNFDKIIELEKN